MRGSQTGPGEGSTAAVEHLAVFTPDHRFIYQLIEADSAIRRARGFLSPRAREATRPLGETGSLDGRRRGHPEVSERRHMSGFSS